MMRTLKNARHRPHLDDPHRLLLKEEALGTVVAAAFETVQRYENDTFRE